MAYTFTEDERIYLGYYYEAGELDAPSKTNYSMRLAEGDSAFGTLVYAGLHDIDVYSLGVLSPGLYSVEVSDHTWDFENFDYSSVRSFSVLDASGSVIATEYSTYSAIDFEVTTAATVYLGIRGGFYDTAQYAARYVRTGDLPLPNHAVSSVSYTLSAEQHDLTLTGAAKINGTGNALDNIVFGNDAANVLKGGDGDDYVDGAAGADRMEGGAGDDLYVVDSSGDRVIELEGEGNDFVFSEVTYTLPDEVESLVLQGDEAIHAKGNVLSNGLYGGGGANHLFGLGGADLLEGNAGDDFLRGGAGADIMEGGSGDDVFEVDSAGDVVFERKNKGEDTVVSKVGYALDAHVEYLFLQGSNHIGGVGNALANLIGGNAGRNRLDGGAGDDILNGGAGSDRVFGDAGDDFLWGDAGADVLSGGKGADAFDFERASDAGLGRTCDRIEDFRSGVDFISLSSIDANSLKSGNQAFRFIGGEALESAGTLRYRGGVVSGDLDGDGKADFQIEISNGARLTADDFLL